MFMNNKTETLQNFEVYRDGELDQELTHAGPTLAETVVQGLQSVVEHAKLQSTMFVYDTVHRTNYRSIRNSLMAEKRNRQHEAAIGLERVK